MAVHLCFRVGSGGPVVRCAAPERLEGEREAIITLVGNRAAASPVSVMGTSPCSGDGRIRRPKVKYDEHIEIHGLLH